MGSGTLLVVDDEPELVALLLEKFQGLGYSVESASDGVEAIGMLREGRHDVVMTDIRMPRASGVEVVRAAQAGASEVEVIILTAHASLDTAIECLRAGAFDLVTKPFDLDALARTVSRAFERRSLRATKQLYETSRQLFSTESAGRLPERIVTLATRLAGADDASLMLPDDRGGLYLAFSNALSEEIRRATELKYGERVAGRVAADTKPVIIQNRVASDPRFDGLEPFRGIHSSIVYPLVSATRMVGVLCLTRTISERPFNEVDLERVGIFANQAAVALDNASLILQLIWNERLAAIGQVAAAVAHELNNPIAYVLSNIEHLQSCALEVEEFIRGPGDGKSARGTSEVGGEHWMTDLNDAIRDAMDGATRVKEIVRDIRMLARPSDQFAVFSLVDTVRSAIRVIGGQFGSTPLFTSVDPDVCVRGSSSQISQVFVNLLSNAAHAVRDVPADHPKEIRIVSRSEGGFVTVAVSDSGVGLSAEEIPRLFRAFFSTKSAEEGTGLGLSISREIVTRHGGEIWAEANSPFGATFFVRLPISEPTGESA